MSGRPCSALALSCILAFSSYHLTLSSSSPSSSASISFSISFKLPASLVVPLSQEQFLSSSGAEAANLARIALSCSVDTYIYTSVGFRYIQEKKKMMRGKEQRPAFAPMKESAAAAKEEVWEVRPGGMLVQKRSPDAEPPPGGAPVPTIRVKVKFNGVYHEVYINAQASFGELKKLLSEKTGLHPDDQKVMYKDRERDSKAFLDMAGVKDRSKLLMLEDPAAKAKRLLEERRTSKADRAAKAISRVSLDVDKLASKVSALETIASKGGKVVDADVVALTEALMNELVKLDAIAADGDVKAQRRMQEKRVQKYVETLDAIRAKNKTAPVAAPRAAGNGHGNKARPPHLPPRPPPAQTQQNRRQFQPPAPTTATAPAPQTATASWETFDLLSSAPSTSAAAVTTMAPATTTTPSPRFEWELF